MIYLLVAIIVLLAVYIYLRNQRAILQQALLRRANQELKYEADK